MSIIGRLYWNSKTAAITTANINTYSVGASIDIPDPGRYIMKGVWSFNTVNSSRVTDVDLSTNGTSAASSGSALYARTRVANEGGSWVSLECIAISNITSAVTMYVKGSATVTSTAQNTEIFVMRIK